MSARRIRRVDGKATRQIMSSSGQVRQDATSECWGVRSSSRHRRVVVVVVVFLSMPFRGRWSGGSRPSGELTARRQDKCLLLGRSSKTRRASVGGFVFVVVSSSCRRRRRRRVALDAFSWQMVGWLSTRPESRRRGDKTNVFCWADPARSIERVMGDLFVSLCCLLVVMWLSMPFRGRWPGGS